MEVDDWHEEQEVERSLDMGKGKRKRGAHFGEEATNRLEAGSEDEGAVGTPPKRQRSTVDTNDEDWEPPAVAKKAKKGIHA